MEPIAFGGVENENIEGNANGEELAYVIRAVPDRHGGVDVVCPVCGPGCGARCVCRVMGAWGEAVLRVARGFEMNPSDARIEFAFAFVYAEGRAVCVSYVVGVWDACQKEAAVMGGSLLLGLCALARTAEGGGVKNAGVRGSQVVCGVPVCGGVSVPVDCGYVCYPVCNLVGGFCGVEGGVVGLS